MYTYFVRYTHFNIKSIYFIYLLFFQVQTDFVQLSDNQFVSTIQDADNINHVVIFLTGVMALPEGMGAKGKTMTLISLKPNSLFSIFQLA